jgi:hypothetical protein
MPRHLVKGIYKSTWFNITDDLDIHQYYCANLKSCKNKNTFSKTNSPHRSSNTLFCHSMTHGSSLETWAKLEINIWHKTTTMTTPPPTTTNC